MYHFEMKPSRNLQWQKELERFFDVFSDNETHFAPACEIHDEEKMYSISLDIPGLRQEDIDIEVKDNHLHISGERKYEKKTDKNNVLRSERRYGKFSRVFSLPQNVNPEGIEASFENGVLQIMLPKEEKSQTRKIQISGWKNKAVETDLKS
jgi:HSP20 family protein